MVDSDISYKEQLQFNDSEIEQRLKTALNELLNRLSKEVTVN